MNQADVSPSQSPAVPAPRGPVALVYSPHAGSAAHGDHPQTLLERAGIEVAVSLPITALDVRDLQGPRWREAGCVAAIAAGGDGTVGGVATHAVSADLPLGILPLGTSNDIARALNLPLVLADAAQVIAHGALHPIDAGQALPSRTAPHAAAQSPAPAESALNTALVDSTQEQSETDSAYFLHALTLGINVEFARLATDVSQRQRWGKLNYVASAFESLEHFKPIPVTLRFSGMPGASEDSIVVERFETALITAINLPVFGGRLGLRIPGVHTDDRMLDFVVVEAPEPHGARAAFESALGAVSEAAQSLWGSHRATNATNATPTPNATTETAETTATTAADTSRQHPVQDPAGVALPGARWFRARAVEIETEQPVELTLDGELRGRTPAVVRVAPKVVQVIVPAGLASQL